MPRKIAVIGAGVIGLFCAYYLRKQGLDVVVFDRGRLGGGCSSGNAGWICPSLSVPVPHPGLRSTSLRWLLQPDSPLYIRPRSIVSLTPWLLSFWRACNPTVYERGSQALMSLAADAVDLYRQLAEDGVDFELHEDGLLLTFQTEAAMRHEQDLLRRSFGGQVRVLNRDDLLDLEPALASAAGASCVGGLHVLPEAHVRPESLCRALADRCSSLGVVFHEGFAVDGFGFASQSRAHSVHGPSGEVEADAFLIANGASAGRLSARCGTRLALQAGKGYSITVSEPRSSIRHALHLSEAKIAVTPFTGGHRIAGTMELSGINHRMDPKRMASLRRTAEQAVPGVLDGASSVDWVGMRPMTPDGLPVMGRLPSSPNVYVSSGHQMLGITLGPASGRYMTSLILQDDPRRVSARHDVTPFDPGR